MEIKLKEHTEENIISTYISFNLDHMLNLHCPEALSRAHEIANSAPGAYCACNFPGHRTNEGAINQGSIVLKDPVSFQENSAQKEVDDLIQEMKIMQEIGSHPHVVTILGVCTEQGENHFIKEN